MTFEVQVEMVLSLEEGLGGLQRAFDRLSVVQLVPINMTYEAIQNRGTLKMKFGIDCLQKLKVVVPKLREIASVASLDIAVVGGGSEPPINIG